MTQWWFVLFGLVAIEGVATPPYKTLAFPNGRVESLAFSPDSRLLAFGTRSGELCLLMLNDRMKANCELGETANAEVSSLSFSRDGKKLAVVRKDDKGNGRFLQLWTISSAGSLKLTSAKPGELVLSASFSPTSNQLAVLFLTPESSPKLRLIEPDRQDRVIDVGALETLWWREKNQGYSWFGRAAVRYTMDGKELVLGALDSAIYAEVVDPVMGTRLRTIYDQSPRGVLWDLTLLPQGNLVAGVAVGGSLFFWSIADGTFRGEIALEKRAARFSYSQDSRAVYLGRNRTYNDQNDPPDDMGISIYDGLTFGKVGQGDEVPGIVLSITTSANHAWLAAATDQNFLYLFKIPDLLPKPFPADEQTEDALWEAISNTNPSHAKLPQSAISTLVSWGERGVATVKLWIDKHGSSISGTDLNSWRVRMNRNLVALGTGNKDARDRAYEDILLHGGELILPDLEQVWSDYKKLPIQDRTRMAESAYRAKSLLAKLRKGMWGFTRVFVPWKRVIIALENIGSPEATKVIDEIGRMALNDELKSFASQAVVRLSVK